MGPKKTLSGRYLIKIRDALQPLFGWLKKVKGENQGELTNTTPGEVRGHVRRW